MSFDLSLWPGLSLGESQTGGNRNTVWSGSMSGEMVAVRRSRRSVGSLDWELDLLEFLGVHDFVVPEVVIATNGDRHVDGVVVQRWLHGDQPSSDIEWQRVAEELRRMHALTATYEQRPDCCAVSELSGTSRSVDADLSAMPTDARKLVESVFAGFDSAPRAVVHGDPGASNIVVSASGCRCSPMRNTNGPSA